MDDYIHNIWGFIEKKEKKSMVLFLFLMIIASLLEIFSFFSLIPFISVLSNPSGIQTNQFYSFLYSYFNFTDNASFFTFLGFISLGVILFSSIFLAFFQWFSFRFLFKMGSGMTVRLFRVYLSQDYSFYLNRNSSQLLKNMFIEMARLVQSVILPINTIISRSLVVILLAAVIFLSDPFLALMITGTLSIAYLIIFTFFRKRLDTSAKEGFKHRDKAVKLGNETFWNIKEIKLYGLEQGFEQHFEKTFYKSFKPDADHSTASALPRYFIEMITFGGIIFLLLYLITASGDLSSAIPLLSLYAFSAYKMLPYLQQIYQSILTVRFCIPTMKAIAADVILKEGMILPEVNEQDRINLSKEIELKGVSFSYPKSERLILANIDLKINANEIIGIIGKTGEGKTTLIDIILGLLQPSSGFLRVDGKEINESNLHQWKSSVGYVPQQIVLWDDTIRRNIGFTAPNQPIDEQRLRQAAESASILNFIENELELGFDTVVGERGIRLSGGQRQRIGIARALYRNPEILVLDEATSALDNETEKAVMEAIDELGGKMTILIIAHRMSTLDRCNKIYSISKSHLKQER